MTNINEMLREKWNRDHPQDLDQPMFPPEYPERKILPEGVAEDHAKISAMFSKPSKLTESLIELFGNEDIIKRRER